MAERQAGSRKSKPAHVGNETDASARADGTAPAPPGGAASEPAAGTADAPSEGAASTPSESTASAPSHGTPSTPSESTASAPSQGNGATPDSVGILFVGDVVGGIGRRTLLASLPLLRERYTPTFTVVNAENVAGGLGITPKIADELLASGVDAITLGNHAYHRREIYPYLDSEPRIVRPANFLRTQPGRGVCVVEHDGVRLGVVNLSGNLYLRAGRSAFTEIEVALSEVGDADQILVDMHAEATSEKVAMGWYLDGRVTAVVGTHTHVPTADARVLDEGTAYITDVGMTGPRGGVIGVKREQALEGLVTQMPVRFETSEVDPWLMGVFIRCSGPRRAASIEQILMRRPSPNSREK